MLPSRSSINRTAALLCLLPFLGCAGPSARIVEEIAAAHGETLVWNDFMPGSRPQCNAVMNVTLRNLTGADIFLTTAEGLISDARNGEPLRRFTALMYFEDADCGEVRLPPGIDVPLAFRATRGLQPFDTKLHSRVKFEIRARTSIDRPLVLNSRPVEPFITQ